MDRRAFLQTLFIGAALAGSRPLRALAAAAVEAEPALLPPMPGPYQAVSAGRRLISGYAGPLYRVRTADGRIVEVYDDGCEIDGEVLVTYDQSGNGRHLIAYGQSDAQVPAPPPAPPPSGLNRHERRRQARLAR